MRPHLTTITVTLSSPLNTPPPRFVLLRAPPRQCTSPLTTPSNTPTPLAMIRFLSILERKHDHWSGAVDSQFQCACAGPLGPTALPLVAPLLLNPYHLAADKHTDQERLPLRMSNLPGDHRRSPHLQRPTTQRMHAPIPAPNPAPNPAAVLFTTWPACRGGGMRRGLPSNRSCETAATPRSAPSSPHSV